MVCHVFLSVKYAAVKFPLTKKQSELRHLEEICS